MTEDFCSWGNRLKRSAGSTIAAKSSKIETLEMTIADQNAKIEKLRADKKRLAEAREQLTRSLSWRLTAPLRRMRSIFGGPRP